MLINSKYSSGAEMKLPIYSSINFRKHLEPQYQEEIIGDIHVTFNFEAISKEPKPILATESKKVEEKLSTSPPKSPPKILLASKTPIQTLQTSSEKKDLVLCLLRIEEGRNFSLETNSLYLTCRLFSDDKHVSTSVAWNSNTKPKFELRHVVPIEITTEFLEEACRDNHLVVEVWNFSEPASQIVGVATISLHQLYTAFHDENLAKKHLSTELPVIAVHDWLSVRDVLAGMKLKIKMKAPQV